MIGINRLIDDDRSTGRVVARESTDEDEDVDRGGDVFEDDDDHDAEDDDAEDDDDVEDAEDDRSEDEER